MTEQPPAQIKQDFPLAKRTPKAWFEAFRKAVEHSFGDIRRFDLVVEAAAMAFFALFSLFPLILVMLMFSVLLGENPAVWDSWFRIVKETLPQQVSQWILQYYSFSQDLKNIKIFSLAFISALWLSTLAFHATVRALRKVQLLRKPRSSASRMFSLFLMFMMYFLAIAMMQILAFGRWFIFRSVELGLLPEVATPALLVLRWLLIIGFSFGSIMMLFVIGSDNLAEWRRQLPGAFLFSFGWIVITRLLSSYYVLFDTTQLVFGAITSLIVLMTWMYSLCSLTLFCARVNANFMHETRVRV